MNKLIMALVVACFFVLVYIAFFKNLPNAVTTQSNGSKSQAQTTANVKAKSLDEETLRLKDIELANPKKLLSVKGEVAALTKKKGLFNLKEKFSSDEIDLFISNSATLATFKDAQIVIDFYSKTQSLLESKTVTIYEYFLPNTTTKKSYKIEIPLNADKVNTYIYESYPAFDR